MEEILNELREIKELLRVIAHNTEQANSMDYSDFVQSISSAMSNSQSVK